jgi:CheY-like chemotaxis protein
MQTDLSQCRVLIVEDDFDLLKFIGSALSAFRVTSCRSAHEALSMLGNGRRFDVLVTGYELLEMSGREVHEHVATLDYVLSRHSLLLVSGRLTSSDEDYLDESHLHVLYMPCKPERLKDEVSALAARALMAAAG